MVGQEILGYTIEKEIGKGSSGTVYKASYKTDIKAIKVISVLPDDVDDIVNIVETIRKIPEHKNVIKYYDYEIVNKSSQESEIHILMEYMTSFPEYYKDKELRVSDVIYMAKGVLQGLEHCHKQGIIHRDIKEDNIFVSSSGEYVIGDFGIAQINREDFSKNGSPNYMAPEINSDNYDETVDIYSLGIVLYKLFNELRVPFVFEQLEENITAEYKLSYEKRMNGEIPQLPSEAPNELGNCIIKAISLRKDRYNSAEEFAEALEGAEKEITGELDNIVHVTFPADFNSNIMNATIKTIKGVVINEKKKITQDDNLFRSIDSEIKETDDIMELDETVADSTDKRGKGVIIGIVSVALLMTVAGIMFFMKSSNNNSEKPSKSNVVTLETKQEETSKTTVDKIDKETDKEEETTTISNEITTSEQPDTSVSVEEKSTVQETEKITEQAVVDNSFTVTGKGSTSLNKVGEIFIINATVNGQGKYKYSFLVHNKTTDEWHRFNEEFNDNSSLTWEAVSEGEREFFVEAKSEDGRVVRSEAINLKTEDPNGLKITANTDKATVGVNEEIIISVKASGGTEKYLYSYLIHNKDNDEWYRFNPDFDGDVTMKWSSAVTGSREFFVEVKDGTGKVVRSEAVSVVVK